MKNVRIKLVNLKLIHSVYRDPVVRFHMVRPQLLKCISIIQIDTKILYEGTVTIHFNLTYSLFYSSLCFFDIFKLVGYVNEQRSIIYF